MELSIRILSKNFKIRNIQDQDTIWSLKTKIEIEIGFHRSDFQLFLDGIHLESDKTLSYYGINKDSEIEIFMKMVEQPADLPRPA